ncbi:7-carboxy-7-deazaguanine synthase [Halomonas sp. McH1-25]|uniref:7-carboxy-7-deazaguanine synthase n=1 Tax=unclassified Halomonas TaxID=2609666 RepID=UPI001EF70490|nr:MULTISPECIES: 7-carboxy-7-deazaguanine synthase [unclassified Halomonas]MCG7598673.1 7-carboxy-7-deazaguanine synthase [Halomonas sp. McH1-25]MCP1340636.1 7-carboxy-7-deazaguanine synthase [Halomonas sp. FL8]MCP1359407.1 7-carboxy-7-deazaguanine synthase [Halomonas sp. BBD45]MCP1364957.1 7-carboxy-7-deazaguanine synthase [Halomonas sp. BBD48]
MYSVKEAFYSLQGEGARAGRASVFCRFSGCNLWSGRERDRATSVCRFCDTDFVGTDGQNGGKFAMAGELASHLASLWPMSTSEATTPYVVFTGGEPLLQLDSSLIAAMHDRGFEIAVETNGTLKPPAGIDWLCVSPKGRAPLSLTQGNEIKLVYPQPDAMPERFRDLAFEHFFLQPMDLDFQGVEGNTLTQTVDYCLAHPQWRLSIQLHKLAGID